MGVLHYHSHHVHWVTGCGLLLLSLGHALPNSLDTANKNEITEQEYDDFFKLVDNFLWDSADEEGRMYRRGYMRMTRPVFLNRRNGYYQEPSSTYRAFVDKCYDFACWSGLNSVVNSVMRLG